MSDVLQAVRDLQLTNRAEAERLLLGFMRDTLGLAVIATRLTPKPTSLNSFNGFVTFEDGQERFFKTHTETHTVIQEYYNASLLANVGYPIIQPTFQSTQTGQQILLYEVIQHEALFDVSWRVEMGEQADWSGVAEAQASADDALYRIYERTLEAHASQNAPIHQLFYHRLAGGRLKQFYHAKNVLLPDGEISTSELFGLQWAINGQVYETTLADIIAQATRILEPSAPVPTVVGHGDAHNGNVFYVTGDEPALLYFDPAFAGRHHPLLDLVKPVFHNALAMWMYYPHEKAQSTPISLKRVGRTLEVQYDYALHPLRRFYAESKVERVLVPTLRLLKSTGALREDWRAFLKSALFCCPFLTMNLADAERFPPSIALLGLCMSVEMGAESKKGQSYLDELLNRAESLC
jgi:hypothetical protein